MIGSNVIVGCSVSKKANLARPYRGHALVHAVRVADYYNSNRRCRQRARDGLRLSRPTDSDATAVIGSAGSLGGNLDFFNQHALVAKRRERLIGIINSHQRP